MEDDEVTLLPSPPAFLAHYNPGQILKYIMRYPKDVYTTNIHGDNFHE